MAVTWNEVAPEMIDTMLQLFPSGLTWRRTFPGRLDQVPEARHFVRFLLADASCCADAEQVVAELAANAVLHTASGRPHGTFAVEVVRRGAVIRIAVHDLGRGGVPEFGRRGQTDLGAERGRGLALVGALASKAGHRGNRETGHAVWAQFATCPLSCVDCADCAGEAAVATG
ncbi:ATP-binding protein [Streptosporangium sp. NPDC051023]|uniref:ATP-binding protein n=1 Tax=Streptosporangium sp. NPDC051023 TaxID=3155410 RepID=UPI00344CFA17